MGGQGLMGIGPILPGGCVLSVLVVVCLVPSLALAGAYEDINKYKDKIFSVSESVSAPPQAVVLKAFIEDDLVLPEAEGALLTIRCWWASVEVYEQMRRSALSLSMFIFDYQLGQWARLGGTINGFQCDGRAWVVRTGSLSARPKAHDLFGITPVKLVVEHPIGEKQADILYQSTSLIGFPSSNRDMPKAVVFDLDRTLTCPEPAGEPMPVFRPFLPMIEEVCDYALKGYMIFYVTARSGSNRAISRSWLLEQGLPPGPLFMAEEPPELGGKSEEERTQILSDSMFISKSRAIATIQKQYDIVAAYGDAWLDIDVYQAAHIPEIVHINWLEVDDDPPHIAHDYKALSSRSYSYSEHGSVRLDHYGYYPLGEKSVGEARPKSKHDSVPKVAMGGKCPSQDRKVRGEVQGDVGQKGQAAGWPIGQTGSGRWLKAVARPSSVPGASLESMGLGRVLMTDNKDKHKPSKGAQQ